MATYTVIHVLISLVGIVSGFVVIYGFLNSKDWAFWTSLFLVTTVLTSVTGYGFSATYVTPGHVVGAISLVVLGFAIYAKYVRKNQGGWRTAYVVNSVVAQYLNFFVLIVQLFGKVPLLKALAPTQSEPPFAVAQLGALVAFILLGTLAVLRFRPQGLTYKVAN